jgi:hypothetical protein
MVRRFMRFPILVASFELAAIAGVFGGFGPDGEAIALLLLVLALALASLVFPK